MQEQEVVHKPEDVDEVLNEVLSDAVEQTDASHAILTQNYIGLEMLHNMLLLQTL